MVEVEVSKLVGKLVSREYEGKLMRLLEQLPPSRRRLLEKLRPAELRAILDYLDAPPTIAYLRLLGRVYVSRQEERMAEESRLRMLMCMPHASQDILDFFERQVKALKSLEKAIVDEAISILDGSPLLEWCRRVKGLGDVAALIYASYINPLKADTAGKARKYVGLTPGQELRSGVKGNFNTIAKGRCMFLAMAVIMARDDYYYPLYKAKKSHYMFYSPYSAIFNEKGEVVNPSACPRYGECKAKAKHPCKMHIDMMARRWLASLLVSHATELYREWLGLDTSNFKKHRNYIPPKPANPNQEHLQTLCRRIEKCGE